MAKIAIIDDDPDIVEAITIILEAKGHDVSSAGNVKEALILTGQDKFDLIILDVMMDEPDDGFYLANRFRKLGIISPIIMLTSIARVTGYEYGKTDVLPIDEFLEKPVQPSVLTETIEKLLKPGGAN